MAEIPDLVMVGRVRLIIDQNLPLFEALKAHAHLLNPGTLGKVLLIP